MYERYEYNIKDLTNPSSNVLCRVEYNPDNSYDTNHYFYDNTTWHKDFIDLYKLSPEDSSLQDDFEEFITNVHDFMVHGNIWDEIKELDDGQTKEIEQYNIVVTAKKI